MIADGSGRLARAKGISWVTLRLLALGAAPW
jgi:hypothetical protein